MARIADRRIARIVSRLAETTPGHWGPGRLAGSLVSVGAGQATIRASGITDEILPDDRPDVEGKQRRRPIRHGRLPGRHHYPDL